MGARYKIKGEKEGEAMTVSYTKEQRAYAKENGLHLCTVATCDVMFQGPRSEMQMRLIRNTALHTMTMNDDAPFEIVKEMELSNDIANWLEDAKLSIVRQRASGFEDIQQYELLDILNALRHFVMMSKPQ